MAPQAEARGSRRWLVGFAGALVLAGAALLVLGRGPRESALGVSVRVESRDCHGECSTAFARDLAHRIEATGLSIARGEDAERAPFEVRVSVHVELDREGLAPGTHLVVARVSSAVAAREGLEDLGAPNEGTFAAEAGTREAALRAALRAAAPAIGAATLGDLFASPALATAVSQAAGEEPPERREVLERSRRSAVAREAAIDRLAEECADAEIALSADSSDARGDDRPGIQCITAPCGREHLLAVARDAPEALIRVEPATPDVPFAEAAVPRAAVGAVERLELRPLDGSEGRVVGSALGYGDAGDATGDGSLLVVEKGAGSFGLVALGPQSGARRTLDRVRLPATLGHPVASADGRFAAWLASAFGRSALDLRVGPVAGGAMRVRARRAVGTRTVTAPLVQGAPVEPLFAFVGSSSNLEPPEPRLIDPADDTRQRSLEAGGRRVMAVAGATPSGAVLLVAAPAAEGGTCELGRVDPATLSVSWSPLERCIDEPRVTSDGRVVAVALASMDGDEVDRDPEIVLVDPATGSLTALTRNAVTDASPIPTPDGTRVVFERRVPFHTRGLAPSAVCSAPLPGADAAPAVVPSPPP